MARCQDTSRSRVHDRRSQVARGLSHADSISGKTCFLLALVRVTSSTSQEHEPRGTAPCAQPVKHANEGSERRRFAPMKIILNRDLTNDKDGVPRHR
jgi:hypothetical protein